MALDDRLRRELDRAAQPADPSGLYEHLIRRRERRRVGQKLRAGVLIVSVLVGTVFGFYGLSRVFRAADIRLASGDAANGVIVFSRGQHPDTDVYTIQPDGRALTNLTSTTGIEDIYPSVSPDGNRIAFCRYADEALGIWIVDIHGTGLTQLTDSGDCSPTWSPDGTRIAFQSQRGGDEGGLYVMNADGSDVRQLVSGTGGSGGISPAWSPTGDWIAFHRMTPGAETPESGIFLVRPDGSGVTKISDGPGLDLWPNWSPDGSQIVFVTSRFVVEPDRYPPVIAVMNADGSNVRQLTTGGDAYSEREPFWSPDGEQIGFVRSGDRGGIYVMAIDGSNQHLITSGVDATLCCPHPSWQPVLTEVSEPPATSPSPEPSPGETVVPEPTPTESPSANDSHDIGLGFPVCNVTSVSGVFAPGVDGSAFVATKMGDTGGCSRSGVGFQVVAIDVSGDGLADASYGPLECETWCSAFAAPDVDGDGIDELLIQNIEFSIVGLRLYEVRSNPRPEVFPVTVAQPGDAPFGHQVFEGGHEPQFWIGGDAFIADAIRCEPGEGGRLFISTTGESRPHDSPVVRFFATETTFILEGVLRVLDVRETIDDPSSLVTTGCGADLDLFN